MNTAAFLEGYMHKEAEDAYRNWLKAAPADAYYDAISDAEHRNRQGSRFIRALHVPGGTTAYGPVQLNKQYIQDFVQGGRYADVFKDKPEMRSYVRDLDRQAKTFAHFGNTGGKLPGYDKKWDYINKGGTGAGFTGDTPEQQQMYKTVALAMMQHRVGKEFGGDWNKYLQAHRGRSAEQDPEYYKAYNDSLQNKYNKYIKEQQQKIQQAPSANTLVTKK